MTKQELKRPEVIVAISEGRLSQIEAVALLGVTTRQIRGLLRRYEATGPAALASSKRGRRSNNQLSMTVK